MLREGERKILKKQTNGQTFNELMKIFNLPSFSYYSKKVKKNSISKT